VCRAVTNRLDTMIGQILTVQTGVLEHIRAMVAQPTGLPTG
jgi:hypothetical protein